MLTLNQAMDRAIAAGSLNTLILDEARRQERNVGTVPFNNMIRALNMMSYRNTKEDWTRLAGALMARRTKRGLSTLPKNHR